jgi:heat shock transcription factor
MLSLIQRQKPGTGIQEDVPSQINEPSAPIDMPAQRLLTDHNLDLSSIVSEIAAIKLQQVAINTNMNLLQSAHQHLWNEALVSRDRHKSQQDTIDRVLEFLAGVYGPSVSPTTVNPNLGHAFVPSQPQKLIGAGIDNTEDTRTHSGEQICKLSVLQIRDEPNYISFYCRCG